ncbi:MAG: hypothetical protein FJZ47_15100 [Candidatus Tectomicrobia bacterium]|uniref:Uncharacterized protein n=1 Tax=Tectimicrobiota bacterium TaxID=2528274 RepID=A0A937W1H6_UNCTE|nr:hypothetical protein [Candidatus Tectomicrobia bacterium]
MLCFWRPQRLIAGFTLWNLWLPMLGGAFLVGGAAHVLHSQAQQLAAVAQMGALVQNARLALDAMSSDVRMAGYNPSSLRFDGLTYTPQGLHVRSDLNGDGDTTDPEEDIRYTYDAAQQRILRVESTGSSTLAEQIQDFRVAGLDGAGQPTTAPSQIRQVQITVVTQQPANTETSDSRPYTLTTLIHLRNPVPGAMHDPS